MTRFANARDGEQLAYRVHGQPGKTALLTAHGLVSSVSHWTFFTPYFSQTRPVVSWEYRGHGGQPVPSDPDAVSVPLFADDAHAVWRAAELEPAVVVGLSFGVQVALEMWRAHRDAIRALVLICGTAGRPLDRISESPKLRDTASAFIRRLGGRKQFTEPFLKLLGTPLGTRIACELAYLTGGAHRSACPVEVLQGMFGHVATLDPRLIGAVAAAYVQHDASDVLPTIDVPTLIIAGDKDQLTPASTAEQMHRAVPGSQLVVFAGHSHLVQLEQPRELHDVIDRFLLRHGL